MLREQLASLGLPFAVLSQRRWAVSPFGYAIDGGRIAGTVRIEDVDQPLERFGGVYIRLMDAQALPEIEREPPDSPVRRRAHVWHEAVTTWCEIAPARVVNRAGAMWSNASKPYQAQVIQRHGLLVPDTLIASEPERVREFARQHGRLVFKSLSGVRSIVRELKEEDLERLDRIRWCPVQFQACIEGRNVRVHTVGEEIFATAISTEAIDYRYASRQGGPPAVLSPVTLSDDLAERCLALARDLCLPFAGIDLKITPDDEVYCFEVNPSPAYSYYESQTGQPISRALARYLAGAQAVGCSS